MDKVQKKLCFLLDLKMSYFCFFQRTIQHLLFLKRIHAFNEDERVNRHIYNSKICEFKTVPKPYLDSTRCIYSITQQMLLQPWPCAHSLSQQCYEPVLSILIFLQRKQRCREVKRLARTTVCKWPLVLYKSDLVSTSISLPLLKGCSRSDLFQISGGIQPLTLHKRVAT